MIITKAELQSFLDAKNGNPHTFLGMHVVPKGKNTGLVVRAFVRDAARCEVIDVSAAAAALVVPDTTEISATKTAKTGKINKAPAAKGKELAVAKTAVASAVLAAPVSGTVFEMGQLAPEGFFEVLIPNRTEIFRYQLRATLHNGEIRQFFDPYSFLPTVGDLDLYLFNEGNDHRIYEKLGAHLREVDGVRGISFAVWAPSAARVSLVGNFNRWDGRYHPMRPLGVSGVWEIFVPGLGEGELYKYEIRDQATNIHLKTDPYGTYFEAPPNNASIVYNPRRHVWGDSDWIMQRKAAAGQLDRPMSIYEVHLSSWKRKLQDGGRIFSYRELAPMLADYVHEMGFTHIEVMPLAEHPFDGSWGYQVTGFYAPTYRHGTPEDFAYFVDHMHQRGIGVILDWVPAHFPRDQFALAEFDGTHLYEHADPRQGAHMDWGTLIFNYGRNEVRCFLTANALAWLDRYHIDGLRVDAVASMLYLDYSRKEGEWIPNKFGGRENLEAVEFLRQTNDLVHHYYPGVVMIAEESTSFAGVSRPTKDGGLGFDYKWNMGWMHDTLGYFQKESVHRKWHQNDLTFGMLYQYAEHFITVFSHDEVTHGKSSLLYKMGAWHIPEKAANLRALYAHMWSWPGKKLLFMGGEFGQAHEWNYAASLDWHLCQYLDHEGIRLLVRDLNALYRKEPVLSMNDFNSNGFRWITCGDSDASVLGFQRMDPFEQDIFVVIGHFTPVARLGYRVGVPRLGFWKEIINTNSSYYGGSGLGNDGGRMAEPIPCDGHAQSILLQLPALSTTIFKWSATAN